MPATQSRDTPNPVVLVDDDEAVRDALTFALGSAGLTVLAFADAEAVLAADLPDDACFVIDERLPGLTGLEVYKALQGRGVHRPTVFITSQPKSLFRAAAAANGVPIVEKPLMGDVLLLAIRAVCEPRKPLS